MSDAIAARPASEVPPAAGTRQPRGVGAAGATAAAALVVGLATVLPAADAASWAAALADQPARGWASVVAFAVAEVAGAAVLVLLATTVAASRRRRARTGALLAGIGFVGNAVLTVGAYAVATGRAGGAVAGDPDAVATVQAARATVDLADALNVGLLGLGLLLLVPVLRAPRWQLGLGVLAGATGVLGALQAVTPAAVPIRLLSGVLYLAWVTTVAVRALRRGRSGRATALPGRVG